MKATLLCFLLYLFGAECIVQVSLTIQNNAGFAIDIFWINIFDSGKLELQGGALKNGSESSINTYSTHSFVFQFHDDIGVQCKFVKGCFLLIPISSCFFNF